MSKSTINDFELGNLIFGISRGIYNFPDRDLVDSKEWKTLMNLLQVEDYHCSMGDYYFDYEDNCNKQRSNGLVPNNYGGYTCKNKEGQVVFEIFPYWWGDCTCGAEEYNAQMEEDLMNSIFSKEERAVFEDIEDWCDDDCPACDWKPENTRKTPEELDLMCTCGTRNKNKELNEKKKAIEEKVKQFYQEYEEKSKGHEDDCLLLKHNFVFMPKTENEVWIDWYKYPFRDSHTNIELTEEMFKKIILICIEYLKQEIK